jgi:hypothetical protein
MVQEARKLKIAPALITKDKKFQTDEPIPESNENLLKKTDRVKSVPIPSLKQHTLSTASTSSYGSGFFSNVLDDIDDNAVHDVLFKKAGEISALVDQIDVRKLTPRSSTSAPSTPLAQQSQGKPQALPTIPPDEISIPTMMPPATTVNIETESNVATKENYDETHIQHPKNAEILATCMQLLQQTQSFVPTEEPSSSDSNNNSTRYSNANIQMALIWLRQASHYLNHNQGSS